MQTDEPAHESAPDLETAEGMLAQYRALYECNTDLAGWIYIDGTSIDYPVMYTPDDGEFYLTRGFDREKSKSGAPFIDARCLLDPPSTNIIIYGHHMNNGTMFTDLDLYRDETFFKEHPTIRFDTLYKSQEHEIIAVFRSRVYGEDESGYRYYDFINAVNEEKYDEYIHHIKKMALYNTGVSASYGDQLLTLITCAYHSQDGRLVVVAKKLS